MMMVIRTITMPKTANYLLVVVAASSPSAQLASVDDAIRVVHQLSQAELGGEEEEAQDEGSHSAHSSACCYLCCLCIVLTTLFISLIPLTVTNDSWHEFTTSWFCSYEISNFIIFFLNILSICGVWQEIANSWPSQEAGDFLARPKKQ